MNPRLVAQHTISSRADSDALALLRDCSLVRLTAAKGLEDFIHARGAGPPGSRKAIRVVFVDPELTIARGGEQVDTQVVVPGPGEVSPTVAVPAGRVRRPVARVVESRFEVNR